MEPGPSARPPLVVMIEVVDIGGEEIAVTDVITPVHLPPARHLIGWRVCGECVESVGVHRCIWGVKRCSTDRGGHFIVHTPVLSMWSQVHISWVV